MGTYSILAAGNLSATNYSIMYTNGTLTIQPYALTVTAGNRTRPYGAQNPVLIGTMTGLQEGDSITASYITVANAASPVGTYAIVPTLNDPNGKLVNYAVTLQDGSLTVTPASLTVVAVSQSRTYGSTNPALTGNFTGLRTGITSPPATARPPD